MSRPTVAYLLSCLLAAAAKSQETTAFVDSGVDEALRSREYERALTLIDTAMRDARPDAGEVLIYQRGLAQLFLGRHETATESFEKLLADHPRAVWASKAAFRLAEALAARKQFERAEKVYAERVTALIGDDRKSRLAKIYVDFASEYFEPNDTFVAPNHEKARTFYDKAIELSPGPDLRDLSMFRRAECSRRLSQWPDAAAQFEAYALVFDPAFRDAFRARMPSAALPVPSPTSGRRVLEARLRLGDCLLNAGRWVDARRTLQDLVRLLKLDKSGEASAPPEIVGDSSPRNVAVEALFLIGKTYQMPVPTSDETLHLGVEAHSKVIAHFPESSQAVWAAFDIAAAFASRGRADDAIAAYQRLISREQVRPGDDATRKLAEDLSQQALFAVGALRFQQRKYADAIGAWNQYVAKYPSGPLWSASQQRIVDAEFQIGADAVSDRSFDAARESWSTFLQKYPLDQRAAAIMFRIGDLSFQEQKWDDAIAHWKRLNNKFPGTEEAGQGQFMIGVTLEERRGRLEAALEAYKAVTWSSYSQHAQARIAAMNETRLLVHTDRLYRTDESAMIRVDTRNIDRVQVKCYRIDMLDYFRKRHTLGGVEALDLVLIDPEKSFTVDLAGFARYKPLTQEIEVAFDGPGVWAVNVSNDVPAAKKKAGEGAGDQGSNEPSSSDAPGGLASMVAGPKIEATTLLIRSDIDIVTKSSRRQMLVFAQNMRTGAPAADVSLLVSDGVKIKLEGKTGTDGVWLARSDDFKTLDSISVLAYSTDGSTPGAMHIAGSDLSLSGLAFSTGLSARGFIYTDKPSYRPGEAVNISGILREVTDGQYSLPVQPEDERLRWKLDVVDAKGRVLHTRDVWEKREQGTDNREQGGVQGSGSSATSEFGTFAAQFRVTEDAPVGEYKIIVRRADGPTFTGAFRVEEYQLSKAFLKFEFDQPFVMRGEAIKGSIVARYHYGEPVVGKVIEFALNDPWTGEMVNRTGETDKEGKVAFEFETAGMPEEAHVAFSARQADLAVEASATVFVAVRALRVGVSTARSLFVSGEPFDVTVEAKDLKGAPVGQDLTLTAYLRTYSSSGVQAQSAQSPSGGGQAMQQVAANVGPPATWSESKVESVSLKSDAVTGMARTSLKLSKGGSYVLRAEGKDRFSHVVSADWFVQISGEDDETRLHLFSERQNVKVGESLAFQVHSRVGTEAGDASTAAGRAAPLALITYEGEEIIGYVTKPLTRGYNPFELAVAHGHFPNFTISVSVMERQSGTFEATKPARRVFQTATRDFTVERQLNIAVKPIASQATLVEESKARESESKSVDAIPTYRPRDEMSVELTVTDHQGKPVSAEVGLLMLDNAVLSQFPDPTPDIVAFFQEGARRQSALRTETSCAFRYAAQTRPMVTEILAEAEREAETLAAELWSERAGGGARPSPVSGATANAPDVEAAGIPADRLATLGYADSDDARAGAREQPQQRLRASVRRAGRGRNSGGAGGGAGGGQLFEESESAGEGGIAAFGVQADGDGLPDHEGLRFFFDKKGKDESSIIIGRKLALVQDRSRALNLGLNAVEGRHLEAELNQLLCNAPPRSYFPEVAYWNPRIVTDSVGKATIKIVMPDSSTRWKLISRGVTPETLVGSGTAEVVSRHDFFVELLPPAELVEGDKFTPLARVHCLTAYKGDVTVELRSNPKSGTQNPKSGDAAPTQSRTVKFDDSSVVDVAFDPIIAPEADAVELRVTASTMSDIPDAGRKLADTAGREVPIRPWGMRVESHAAGIRSDTEFVELEMPSAGGNAEVHDTRLTVAVGPSMQHWLVEEALESGKRWETIELAYRSAVVAPPRSNGDAASALLGAIYVADYVRAMNGGKEIRNEEKSAESGIHNPNSKTKSNELHLLEERVAGLVAQLLATQNDDGGWPWAGKGRESDPWTTAHVAWALGKAIQSGHGVHDPAIQRLRAYLNKAFADARAEQAEFKSVVLHGISWVETADFAHANRLYRNRQTLSSAALGHLALTFARLERASIAGELLAILTQKMKERPVGGGAGPRSAKWLSAEGCSAWLNSELEVTALALLAQLSVDARSAAVKPMVDYLAATARHDGWHPHKARGTVLAALATYYANSTTETANYRLSVGVNGRDLREVKSDESGSVVIVLSESELWGGTDNASKSGRVRVDFKFEGRGEYAYAATLSAFSRAYPEPKQQKRDILWVENRIAEQPTVEWKGKWVVPGWSTAQEYKVFRNVVTALPVGMVTRVEIEPRRNFRADNAAGDRDYIVVQETIPAGFRLVPGTVEGNFLSFDFSDNVLTLYYGSQRDVGQASYHMVATTPGAYRMPPTIIRSLYRPEARYVNRSDQIVTVLARGEKTPDVYRMSPDQLFNLGKYNHDEGQFDLAGRLLKELIDGEWILRPEPYRESIRMLLSCALRQGEAEQIVNYFEILKEKFPELVVPFEDIVKVAAAYGRTGQHERAYIVWRATADASFARDAEIGGTLQGEGRFLESIDFMEDLWREHPDTPQVESIFFALSQSVYAKAVSPADVQARRGKAARDGSAKTTKHQIVRETIRLLERFLTMYPQSPAADEASYSLANAYLDLDDFQTVLARTARMIELFPKSKWLDRFRYIRALAYFNLGEFELARKLAEEVAASTYKDEQGVERPSPNKWLALYIIGQIHHAMGHTREAIEFYKKVREQFSDAHEAVEFFEHKFVRLPEVTIFHPSKSGFYESEEWEKALKAGGVGAASEMRFGATSDAPRNMTGSSIAARDAGTNGVQALTSNGLTPAPLHTNPFIQLSFRNVQSAVLQVYRVDLMKLALMEKSLSQITAVNLAGVKPILEKTVRLGDGLDYQDRSLRIELDAIRTAATTSGGAPAGGSSGNGVRPPVRDDVAGAYLVICRADDLLSSGLVLVTPLAVEVQEDLASRRTRVNVVDALTRGGMKNVHVKVIGMGMNRFVTGESDLRGVFLADGVSGYPTAIAKDAAGHFAFHRSEGALLALAASRTQLGQVPEQLKSLGYVGGGERGQAEYRKNLWLDNCTIQAGNDAILQGIYKSKQKGVEVQRAQ